MRVPLALCAVTAFAVGGCATPSPPITAPEVPRFSEPSTAASSRGERTIPAACGSVATTEEITRILGSAVTGRTLDVAGVPDPKIGRTARLDCYYGVPDGQPPTGAAISIGLASYSDAAAAQKRVTSTADSERAAGSTVTDVKVGTDTGVLLDGPQRTLVAAHGKITVVVTARTVVVASDRAAGLLPRIADLALTPR